MDNIRKCIEILFKKVPPEAIINSYFNDGKSSFSHCNINRNIFTNLALSEFEHYSEDEILNILNLLNNKINIEESNIISVFNLLKEFSDSVLLEINEEPCCRYEQMLRWRMLSHKLEQDIFTTSFLADRDINYSKTRTYFAWNQVIKSDNIRLKNMLNSGMAENHFHLKGSAPVFSLTWVSLMNNIVDRQKDFNEAGITNKRLVPDIDFGEESLKTDFYVLVKKASVIRAFLFCLLNNIKFMEEKEIDEFLKDQDILHMYTSEIQSEINFLKHQFGIKHNNDNVIDYANMNCGNQKNKNSNWHLVGERCFLYYMFKAIYENNKKISRYTNLFYAYLVIKLKFKAELIQNNDRVGFKNFADYQDRKSIFISNNPVLKDAVYSIAITSTLSVQNLTRLEARIMPENSAVELYKEIRRIDKIVTYDSNDSDSIFYSSLAEKDFKHYFVLHFPKSKDKCKYIADNSKINNLTASIQPRHYLKRNEVKQQSLAITSLRNSNYFCVKRILGIDACANEVGCRPEVFAQAFRYLRNHSLSQHYKPIIENDFVPQLKCTYHVGEDFLDIVDGLRAIDEVLYFLQFTQGDRLGHALALGVDVREWYNFKKYTLVLPMQDMLDNIVWLLSKIREYNIENASNLVYELQNTYYRLFSDIYTDSDAADYEIYYDAWKLRGDNPYCYLFDDIDKKSLSLWDNFNFNNIDKQINYIRKNKSARDLYNKYHFDPEIKRKGTKQYEFKVPQNYVNVVEKVQKELMKIVSCKGIGIETNPSSNYLIGTFKRYDKHPILKFFNLGLTADSEKIKECPQLFVSINTDDQGVFDTYLENEYALMAIALEKAKDSNGELIYNSSMIYEWLDNIRQMGLQQTFAKGI